MTIQWLMTVQEVGEESLRLENSPIPYGIQFDRSPRWFSPASENYGPSPNPNRFDALRRWPTTVEIRRPDGTRVNAQPHPLQMHLNYDFDIRYEQDSEGRIRNPWRDAIIFSGVTIDDIPIGSEIWGDVSEDDFREPEDLNAEQE